MDQHRKKSVRFSSPFETNNDVIPKTVAYSSAKRTHTNLEQSSRSQKSFQTERSRDVSMDSWDAFDAKMHQPKSKSSVARAQHKFLEMSSSQNRSLQITDADFSFQDPRDIIDKDEKERLLFMNSNMSFSESKLDDDGIEQIDRPSLLSFTSYFQQGSSFPESLLMPRNENLRDAGAQENFSFNRGDSFSQHEHSRRRTSVKLESSFSTPTQIDPEEERKSSNNVSRSDSLARFFLSSESDGLDKSGIMDYVLEYCKRRASLRLSDASSIGFPSPENPAHSINDSRISSSDKRDSGVEIGNDKDKTIGSNFSREDSPNTTITSRVSRVSTQEYSHHSRNSSLVSEAGRGSKHVQMATFNNTSTVKKTTEIRSHSMIPKLQNKEVEEEKEKSVMITDGGLVSEISGALDASDVSFEKFKKNLHRPPTENRYRTRSKQREEFEKKRLKVDEQLQLQPQQHYNLNYGNGQCSCPHQHTGHGQLQPHVQNSAPGLVPVPGVGMPIVIHIHLPCMGAAQAVHAVATPTTENPK